MVEITQVGQFDMHFEKFDEDIVFQKPQIIAKNIIFGGLYIDLEGCVKGISYKTGY